eukprot:CAMPEP_0201581520 /NCGR_PEP_ID=MMETSP0190_2-20130828/70506_1 /ASSEMBLY_ACC=CAM_ASM_000263 /TAXON_ID=37353 /ORGANISM="Rosalina sp." /LENGTH=91 /DNA_ID=CAMNT_0048019701 /DNA_START=21 /DNA_END=297 /DNA_ORIENTATION=-
MLPKGPFQATDFKPDIPQDKLNQLNVQTNTDKKEDEEDNSSQRMTARDYSDREQQEKEDYRKRRLRDEKEKKNTDRMQDLLKQIIHHLTVR